MGYVSKMSLIQPGVDPMLTPFFCMKVLVIKDLIQNECEFMVSSMQKNRSNLRQQNVNAVTI